MKLSDRLSDLIDKYGMMYDDYETMVDAAATLRKVEESEVVELTASEAYTIGWWPEGSGKRVRIVEE